MTAHHSWICDQFMLVEICKFPHIHAIKQSWGL